ncbi:MAG: polyhydroxyalkanoic acid system family protein [Rhodoferax sp.]|uniref:polyhydroxyalkanoic acid system family protein n=1 Tax=Rhodoferax sp. TaxID=50421 RepID=UPI001B45EDF0|nr:polyhydroxyalkanoic acid system family protein [Rhodoferax sp.]MBP9904728.1 polyhydroxyalkanoic acid system family protein [Rhodoferax sp.]
MADLHIVREHSLGLAKARKIAFQWAEQVEADFGMACSYAESKGGDEVVFSRSGVKGNLLVHKDRFELRAQLGFLLGAFKHKIEAEIVKNLDTLLAPKTEPQAPRVVRARPKQKAGSAE